MSLDQVAQLLGRVVFSAFFIISGVNHLLKTKQMAEYAKTAGNVPAPAVAVVLTGLMLLGGGLSLLLGYHPRIGSLLLFVFLVPTAFMMHQFWKVSDPMQKAGEMAQFWKNITLAGAALYIASNPHWPWPMALGNIF